MRYSECHIEELQHLIATQEDQLAYKELYNRLAPGMIAFATHYVHDLQAAEEIVSDVFIRVWVRRATLDHIGNLKVYVYVSVRNFSNNYLKSKKTQSEILPLSEIENTLATPDYLQPQQIVHTKMMRQRILVSINQLPPRCGEIFRMAKEEGLKIAEIAEILKISPKTVENQLTIGFKKMAAVLMEFTDKVIRLRS
jgi:RNA polymerase sigma-70 factor (ECF subfamily)